MTYLVPCGDGGVGGSAPIGVANAGGGGCGALGGLNTASGSGSGSINPVGAGAGDCNPCGLELLGVMAQCAFDFLVPLPDTVGCAKDTYGCYQGLAGGVSLSSSLGCLSALVSCLAAAGKDIPYLGQILTALGCADNLLSACGGGGLAGALGFGGKTAILSPGKLKAVGGKAATASFPGLAEIQLYGERSLAVLYAYTNFFGDTVWIEAGANTNLNNWLPLFASSIGTNSADGFHIDATERAVLTNNALLADVPADAIKRFLDRWN